MSEYARKKIKEADILIIAHEYIIRGILARFLTAEGYRVVTHSVGWSGIRAFEKGKGRFDLVMIDKELPDMSGVGAAKKIKVKSRKTPIILLKEWDSGANGGEFKDSGVDFIISKPFLMEEALRLVENAIERGGMR